MAEHPIKWKEELFEIERHPYETYIPKGARTLIIGTFPAHQKNADFKFFYGGSGNQFWPLLSNIYADRPFKKVVGDAAKRERIQLLDRSRIGVTDMLTEVYRYRERSGDEFIFPIKFNNILSLLDLNPGIERLVFTSRQYVIGALGLFQTYLLTEGLILDGLQKNSLNYLHSTWFYKDRPIKIRVPVSPSKRVITEKRIDFEDLASMYRQCLRD